MVRDERISQARRHVTATGYGIWYILLLAMLIYRQVFLGQPLSEYWDIALTFFVGTLYVTIACFAQGAVYETQVIRYGKWMFPSILITIEIVLYLRGGIKTVIDLLAVIISASVTLSLLGLLLFFLYRHWEKKHHLAD